MKSIKYLLFAPLLALGLTACDDDLRIDDDAESNFETLWRLIDERYCFFELKKDSIRDWNELYAEYKQKALESRTDTQLFDVFASMLNELKDGHVNLTSEFDVSDYDLDKGFNDNFNIDVLKSENYLGDDYRKAGGLTYKLLNDKYGYIRYASFSNEITDDGLDYILNQFSGTKGLIIDVRNNGGGNLAYVDFLVSRFIQERTHVGYWQRKTGKGHNDFSEPIELYVEPSGKTKYLIRPIVVLTDRGCYSATNCFAQYMSVLPNVVLMGDVTGGGSGVPVSSELPCGWTVRFSSAIYSDINHVCYEWGIKPDIAVSLDKEQAYLNNIDTIIEAAKQYIDEHDFDYEKPDHLR